MFILDTNVISELRHGKPRQSPEVRCVAHNVEITCKPTSAARRAVPVGLSGASAC